MIAASTGPPLGLRQRQVVALSHLQGHGPTPQQTLAGGLCMDPSSTVCLLNELEGEDLVVRRRDRSDRRRGVVALSAKGELALREVNAATSVQPIHAQTAALATPDYVR